MDVVDADLQLIQSGPVQSLNAFDGEEISVGYQSRDNAMTADAPNDFIELGMKQGFSATNCDNGGTQRSQMVNPAEHLLGRHRLGKGVEFVAIGAGQVTASNRNNVR